MIYIVGSSKDGNKVAAIILLFSVRLPDEASIFTADKKATELAFDHIKFFENIHFTIFSDSLSCLQFLPYMNIDYPFFGRIFQRKISANRLALVGMVSGRHPQLGQVLVGFVF